VSALIVPHSMRSSGGRATRGSWSERADLVANSRVVDFYRHASMSGRRPRAFERIVRFALLPNADRRGGEITPTMKVRRKAAAEKYRRLIDAMYSTADAAAARVHSERPLRLGALSVEWISRQGVQQHHRAIVFAEANTTRRAPGDGRRHVEV